MPRQKQRMPDTLSHDLRDKEFDATSLRTAKMVCGACCVADCKMLKAYARAIESGEEATKQGGSGEFVRVVCSNPACEINVMHAECLDVLERRFEPTVASFLKRRQDHLKGPHELWMSKAGRNRGMYEAIRADCACACGKGHFRALYDSKGKCERVGEESPPPDERRKATLAPAPTPPPPRKPSQPPPPPAAAAAPSPRKPPQPTAGKPSAARTPERRSRASTDAAEDDSELSSYLWCPTDVSDPPVQWAPPRPATFEASAGDFPELGGPMGRAATAPAAGAANDDTLAAEAERSRVLLEFAEQQREQRRARELAAAHAHAQAEAARAAQLAALRDAETARKLAAENEARENAEAAVVQSLPKKMRDDVAMLVATLGRAPAECAHVLHACNGDLNAAADRLLFASEPRGAPNVTHVAPTPTRPASATPTTRAEAASMAPPPSHRALAISQEQENCAPRVRGAKAPPPAKTAQRKPPEPLHAPAMPPPTAGPPPPPVRPPPAGLPAWKLQLQAGGYLR